MRIILFCKNETSEYHLLKNGKWNKTKEEVFLAPILPLLNKVCTGIAFCYVWCLHIKWVNVYIENCLITQHLLFSSMGGLAAGCTSRSKTPAPRREGNEVQRTGRGSPISYCVVLCSLSLYPSLPSGSPHTKSYNNIEQYIIRVCIDRRAYWARLTIQSPTYGAGTKTHRGIAPPSPSWHRTSLGGTGSPPEPCSPTSVTSLDTYFSHKNRFYTFLMN